MVARISALVVWALVAATVVFWGLRLFVQAPAAPANAVAVGDSTAVRGDLARLFGSPVVASAAQSPVAEASSRFRLLGIMAPRPPGLDGGGVALIAVDGKPARAFAVGAALDDSLVLQSVSLRSAELGPANGPASVTLQMPPLASAATGQLTPLGGAPVPPARFVPPYSPNFAPGQTPGMVPPGGMPPSSANFDPNPPTQ